MNIAMSFRILIFMSFEYWCMCFKRYGSIEKERLHLNIIRNRSLLYIGVNYFTSQVSLVINNSLKL